MQRTLDLDVTHITFYDKRRNINRKRRVLDICYDIYDVNYNGRSFYGGSCIGGGEKAEQKTGDIDSKLQ